MTLVLGAAGLAGMYPGLRTVSILPNGVSEGVNDLVAACSSAMLPGFVGLTLPGFVTLITSLTLPAEPSGPVPTHGSLLIEAMFIHELVDVDDPRVR